MLKRRRRRLKWKLAQFILVTCFLMAIVLLVFPSGSSADAVLTGYMSTLSVSGDKEAFKRECANKQNAGTNALQGGPGEFIFPFKAGEGVWGTTAQSPPGIRTNPYSGAVGALHWGFDMSANRNIEIYSICDGTVIGERHDVMVEGAGGTGNKVVIQSGDVEVTYMHMNWGPKSGLVKVGDAVKAGQLIGVVGSTGGSTGPHLHLEIRSADRLRGFSAMDLIEKKIPIEEADYFLATGVWYNYKGEQIARTKGN